MQLGYGGYGSEQLRPKHTVFTRVCSGCLGGRGTWSCLLLLKLPSLAGHGTRPDTINWSSTRLLERKMEGGDLEHLIMAPLRWKSASVGAVRQVQAGCLLELFQVPRTVRTHQPRQCRNLVATRSLGVDLNNGVRAVMKYSIGSG